MLKQKFLVHFGSNFIIRILAMFAGIIVARVAGPEVVGVIAYGTAYVGIWGFITGLFGSGHIKLVSEGQDIGRCMKVYSRLFLGSLIVYFVAVAGFFLFQNYVLRVEFESKAQQVVIMLLLFATIFNKIYEYGSTTFTATMEQAKANLPFFIKNIAWQTGRIVVVLMGFKAVGLATWNLVITFLLLPLVYKLLKKYPGTGWDYQLFKKYASYAVPILLIVIIDSIIRYSDKLLLVHYTNTTELGYYSAAYSIGGMIILASVSIGNIFFPLFSSLLAKNDWKAVNKKINSYQEFITIFIFPSICILVIIAEPLLTTVLGSRYEPSVIPFIILAFATYVVIVGMPYGNIISGMGRFYLTVWINVIKLVVFVFSITFFISPRYLGLRATGLALNLLVINILTNLLFLFFSKKIGKVLFMSLKNIIRYVLVLGFSFSIFYLTDYFEAWSSFWWIIIVPFYLCLIYGALFLTGLLQKNHWTQLMELANAKKIFNYVRNELGNKNE